MNSNGGFKTNRVRLITFAAVAVFHIMLLLFVVFHMETVINPAEPVAGVMRLFDLREQAPPEEPPEEPITNTQEIIAETMIETDEVPPPLTVSARSPAQTYGVIDYLPAHLVDVLPVLPEDELLRALTRNYPPIALRSNIEGTVYIEIFVDTQGTVRDVRIIREDPPNRGFGEAAVNVFRGIRGKPAEAKGMPIAVRYRYPIKFTLQ